MFGYRVYDKFDNMSYLITRSCFYRDEEESDDEIDSNYFRDALEYSFRSNTDDFGDAKKLHTNNYTSSESQALIEESTS